MKFHENTVSGSRVFLWAEKSGWPDGPSWGRWSLLAVRMRLVKRIDETAVRCSFVVHNLHIKRNRNIEVWIRGCKCKMDGSQINTVLSYMVLITETNFCWSFKADSHTACRVHAVPLPCLAAKSLECVTIRCMIPVVLCKLWSGGLRQNTTGFTKFITLTTCFSRCGPSSGHKSTKGRLCIVYKHRY